MDDCEREDRAFNRSIDRLFYFAVVVELLVIVVEAWYHAWVLIPQLVVGLGVMTWAQGFRHRKLNERWSRHE